MRVEIRVSDFFRISRNYELPDLSHYYLSLFDKFADTPNSQLQECS